MSLCASTLRKSFGSYSLLRQQQQHLRHIPMNRAQQQHALFFTQTSSSSSNHTTVHNTHQNNNNNHNNNHNNNNKRRGWWYKTSVGSALLVSTYLVSTTCMDWYNDCVIGRRNTIHIHDESFMKSTIESISEKYRFCPTWYLHNTHLQTIVNALGRQLHMKFSIDRQQFKFSTPGDGDDDDEEYYVYLDYIYNDNDSDDDDKKQQQQKNKKKKKKNILLIIPGVFAGTEGVSVKQFIQHASSAEEGNYQCVVLNFTCENGEQMGHRNIIPGLPPRPPIHNNHNQNNNHKSKNVNRDDGDCTTDLLVHSIVQHLYQQLHDTSDDASDDARTESKSSSLVVMGISLGSNILCNYLSRFPQQSAQMIDAAVALANPFDLVNTTRNLSSSTSSSSSSLLVNHSSSHVNNNSSSSSSSNDENHHEKWWWWWWWFNMKSKMNQFYDRQLLIKRKMMMQQNLHHYILPDSLLYREMMDELNRVESTREFDLKYTLPLFSLASGERQQDEQQQEGSKREQELDHYYASQSSKHQIHKVQVPLLCIHAKDDRISLMENAPIDAVQENHNLAFLCTEYGGHVGWLSGWTPLSSKEPSWMETVVVEYLNRMTNKRSDNRA